MSAIEATFNGIYTEHGRRLRDWFYWHLPENLRGRAEDLAQEAFLGLWEHLLKGRPVDYPFALLKRMGQRRLADEFSIRSRDCDAVLVDVIDPESPSVETIGSSSRYAAGDPEMALISAELDTAMDRMREASARWRALHADVSKCRSRIALYKDPAKCTRWAAEMEAAAAKRDDALLELQEACRVVGNLRGELERAGGGCWQSSCGWPPSCARDGSKRKGHASSDLSQAQCSRGHRLDDIENVNFTEDGVRNCRPCFAENARKHRERAEVRS